MKQAHVLFGAATWLACAVVAAPLAAGPHDHAAVSTADLIRRWEAPERATWQFPDRVVSMLALSSGQSVADIGSGSGYFTVRLARAVTERGRVYAVDIERELMAHLEQRVRVENLPQVRIHAGRTESPALPPESIDLAFMCDVLHHVDRPSAYLIRLRPALRSTGRLAIIESRRSHADSPTVPRIDREAVIELAKRSGYRLVAKHDFLPRQFFLIFEKWTESGRK